MAVLSPQDRHYPSKDSTMDPSSNPRQRSSPANDQVSSLSSVPHHHTHLPQLHANQQSQSRQQTGYTYPVQQQPQGGWTPSIAAAPFYPSFFQNHQQPSPQAFNPQLSQQPPYFDPANAQLAQWAYQQMIYNAQHGFSPMGTQLHSSSQRTATNTSSPNDYFSPGQIPPAFNPFPSGTPPPHAHRAGTTGDHQGQQNTQYPGFHPYRRPNRQQHSTDGNEWRSGVSHIPYPPYARPDASGSTSSVNSTGSQRQRTNSNQSGNSGHNVPSANTNARTRNNGSPAGSTPSSTRNSPSPATSSPLTTPSPLRSPHTRNTSSSSTTISRPSNIPPSSPTTATSLASSSGTSSTNPQSTLRPARPSPLSQGTFTASERRMSRDDSDIATMLAPTPTASMMRSGGLKGRLRRALSFNAAQTLQEEENDDDDESIKASTYNVKSGKAKAPILDTSTLGNSGMSSSIRSPDSGVEDGVSGGPIPAKKKGRAASLFNSRLNASTDNISLSSTVSSASVMIRKLGSMGKLARRNSLAGIASLFKDKDKDKDKDGEGKDKKSKKKDKKSGSKGVASEASVSHVTAELDRSSSGDWTVGGEMNGLSPAAKLARQHTLKSNAEAAAKAKALQEAQAAATAGTSRLTNGMEPNGAGVPMWDKDTTSRQGSVSPIKSGGGMRVNEDGTRVFVEDDDETSDEGHYGHQQAGQSFNTDGWDDDDDWDVDAEGEADEDVTIRVGMERSSIDDEGYKNGANSNYVEPWAVGVRRSIEKTKLPAKGILKYAANYSQQAHLAEQPNTSRARSNSYNSHPGQSELGPLARIPSPDPDHIDGLHKHGLHSSPHGHDSDSSAPSIPPLPFEETSSPMRMSPDSPKELPSTPTQATHNPSLPPPPEKSTAIFQHPNFNSSAPVLSTTATAAPTLTHRSATTPHKRLAFASNLSVYDTFSAAVYDRRSEPATWSRLTPALAQRIKEELNSYKMEEMEVHAASRIHTQFFV